MRTVIICAAAAILTLAACQRPAEETADSTMTDEAAMEATPADGTGAGGARTGAAPGSNGNAAAPAAGEASADTAAMAPADDGAAEGASPVSQATRDGAKEKAESTNLHPRT